MTNYRSLNAAHKQLAAAEASYLKHERKASEASVEIDALNKRIHWLSQDPDLSLDPDGNLAFDDHVDEAIEVTNESTLIEPNTYEEPAEGTVIGEVDEAALASYSSDSVLR